MRDVTDFREFHCRHMWYFMYFPFWLVTTWLYTIYQCLDYFSSGIFLLSSSFWHIYLCKHQCSRTSFWYLCGNQFYEFSGLRFQSTCSYYSFSLLRCHWGLFQKQLVEMHQIQDHMVSLLNWILCQHFLLFWCQVSNKLPMSKT